MSNRIEHLRGQYQSCPFLVLSFPRCGRTWIKLLLGHYISKMYNIPFTKRLEKKRSKVPAILFRHDFMSNAGEIPWEEFNKLKKRHSFLYQKEMESQKIIYLFRDPLDVIFSYWPYLEAGSYHNFQKMPHTNIIEFAKDKEWGLDLILKFQNMQVDHYEQNKNEKILIKYEMLKTNEEEWQRLIKFLFNNFDDEAFQYAKKQTEFKKLQKENKSDRPPELAFFRKGQSNYADELPEEQKEILMNWPGYKELKQKIGQF